MPLAGEEVLDAGDDEAGSVLDADNDGQAEISAFRVRWQPGAGIETGQESDKEWVANEGVENEEEAYEDGQAHGVRRRTGADDRRGALLVRLRTAWGQVEIGSADSEGTDTLCETSVTFDRRDC